MAMERYIYIGTPRMNSGKLVQLYGNYRESGTILKDYNKNNDVLFEE